MGRTTGPVGAGKASMGSVPTSSVTSQVHAGRVIEARRSPAGPRPRSRSTGLQGQVAVVCSVIVAVFDPGRGPRAGASRKLMNIYWDSASRTPRHRARPRLQRLPAHRPAVPRLHLATRSASPRDGVDNLAQLLYGAADLADRRHRRHRVSHRSSASSLGLVAGFSRGWLDRIIIVRHRPVPLVPVPARRCWRWRRSSLELRATTEHAREGAVRLADHRPRRSSAGWA